MRQSIRLLKHGAPLCRNQVSVGNQANSLCDRRISPAIVARRRKFANQYGCLFRVEFQLLDKIVLDLLDPLGPIAHLVVRLSLMEQKTLDHPFLLRNLANLDDALVQVATIFVQVRNPPPGRRDAFHLLDLLRIAFLVEQVDALPADSHIRHSDTDAIRKLLDHLATKEIRYSDHRLAMPHRRLRRI